MKRARSIRQDLLPPDDDPEAAPADPSRTARAGGLLMTPGRGLAVKKARPIRRDLLSPEGEPQAALADRSRTARATGLLMTVASGRP